MLLIALAVVLAPGAGAGPKERVGTRVNLFAGPVQSFPANQPFYINHGWRRVGNDPGTPPPAYGRYGFSLAVDGEERPEDYVDRFQVVDSTLGPVKARLWVHNFPDGLTGTHTFTGRWFGPCTGLVNDGYLPGPCTHPTEVMTSGTLTITVVFTP